MRFVIFGGGCYGSFYARQLVRAHEAGIDVSEIVVVDHNRRPAVCNTVDSPLLRLVCQPWDDFCDGYFTALPPDSTDQIVPPPFTPHLAVRWLLRRLALDRPDVRWSIEPISRMPGTPFQHQSDGGPLTLSHAAWICPVNCIEPERCPKTRGPRYWDLARTVEDWSIAFDGAGQPVEQTHLFQCLHHTHGVGTYAAARVTAARRAMRATPLEPGQTARFLVGTVSRCHGAINLVKAEVGTDTVSTGRQFILKSKR